MSAPNPQPFMPTFDEGAMDRFGAQMNRMMDEMGRAFDSP